MKKHLHGITIKALCDAIEAYRAKEDELPEAGMIAAFEILLAVSDVKTQCDALAAENSALISAFMPKEIPIEATDNLDDTAILKIDGDEFHSWQWIDNQDDVIRGVLDFFKPKTPATDAYLNSVRAEGIQLLLNKYAPHTIASSEASEFAARLRAGKDGE